MKRTREPSNLEIYLPKSLVDKFLNLPNFPDVVALYVFYYQKALKDKTNQPYATNEYCLKGMHIGKTRFYPAKKALIKLKLIEEIEVGRTRTSFGTHYIRVINYKGTKYKLDDSENLKNNAKELKISKELEIQEKKQKLENEIEEREKQNLIKLEELRKEYPINSCPSGFQLGIDTDLHDKCDSCGKRGYIDHVFAV